MAIPRKQLQDAVDRAEAAGMPDTVMVGVPVSLIVEILAALPVEVIRPVATSGATA